jgi:N-acetylneuraminic acid mutarotase
MNSPKLFLYFLSSILLLSCNEGGADSPYPTISFEKKASMPGAGRASAVTFVIDGKGYVTLGRNGNATDSLKECWQYDPAADSWTQKTTFPGRARVKATAAVMAGKAYVGLGYRPYVSTYVNGNYKDFWMYDPALNTWTQKADFPSLATDACVSFVMDNCIYVGEGFNDTGFTNEFWKYDPQQDAWTQLKDFPDYARAGAVLCTDGTRVFFGTGFRWNFNDWWEYFPKTDRWEKRKSMPDNGRVNAVSLSVAGRFFVSTGRHFAGDLTGGRVLSDILEYDAIRNVWYKRGNIAGGGRENAIAFTINGKGYIGFGEDDKGVLNDFWSFEP